MTTARRALALPPMSSFIPAPLPRPRRHRPPRRRICCAAPSLSSLAASVRSGSVSATSLTEASLSRIAQVDPTVGAFLHVDAERALSRAASVDRDVAAGRDPGPLAGVPVAVKDNLCTAGQPTTAASAILDGFAPAYDATVVARLLDAGAVVLGKTNMDEFGMGSSTETSAYHPTRNPWDLRRVPGGSSGGSAAAVAAGEVPLALGSDTGGSIRQPAAYCGVTGLKPSYGRVSRHGLLAYGSSFDTVGPLCRSVADAALTLQTIGGTDRMDGNTTSAAMPDYLRSLPEHADLSGVTLGVVEEALGDGVDADVRQRVEEAVDTMRRLGATIRHVSLPDLRSIMAAYFVLAFSEASANLARYDGVRFGARADMAENAGAMYARSRAEGFGRQVKRRIMAGTYTLSAGYYDAYYVRAQRVRGMVVQRFQGLFAGGVDALVMPVAPTPAFRIGEKTDDAVDMLLEDVMTIPPSLAGLPALSVPCGMARGLPVGLQVVGPFMREEAVLRVGHAFQLATDFHESVADVAKGVTAVGG